MQLKHQQNSALHSLNAAATKQSNLLFNGYFLHNVDHNNEGNFMRIILVFLYFQKPAKLLPLQNHQ